MLHDALANRRRTATRATPLTREKCWRKVSTNDGNTGSARSSRTFPQEKFSPVSGLDRSGRRFRLRRPAIRRWATTRATPLTREKCWRIFPSRKVDRRIRVYPPEKLKKIEFRLSCFLWNKLRRPMVFPAELGILIFFISTQEFRVSKP